MRLGLLLDESRCAVGARSDPGATVEPGGGIGFVTGHGERGASLQRKRNHARSSASLKLQFFRKRRHGHAPRSVRTLRSGSGITNVFYLGVRVGGTRDHFLILAVPPRV